MAAIAEQLTTDQYVESSLNLRAFEIWAAQAEEDDLDEVMKVIQMTEHDITPWGQQ